MQLAQLPSVAALHPSKHGESPARFDAPAQHGNDAARTWPKSHFVFAAAARVYTGTTIYDITHNKMYTLIYAWRYLKRSKIFDKA